MTETMPEAFDTPDLWLVITNAQSWGRGETAKDAIERAVSHAVFYGAPQDLVCHVYLWKDAPPDVHSSVRVDDLGGFTYPEGKPPTYKMITPNALVITAAQIKLRTAWADALDDMVMSDTFAKTFDWNT